MTNSPNTPQASDVPKGLSCFFLAACSVQYTAKGRMHTHMVNTMLEATAPNITRNDLNAITQAAHQRAADELDVKLGAVKFVTIVSVQLLNVCSPAHFHGDADVPTEEPTPKGVH